jgi:magnesium chelatase family protein
MVAKIWTVAFQGIDTLDVEVQVQMTNGSLPSFAIVGLADKAVGESRERIRNALHAIGLSLPAKKITVNLAPAHVQKEGTHYDLPIILALLGSMGVLNKEELLQCTAVGELALDGGLASVPGVLPAAFQTYTQNRKLICPSHSGSEAAWIKDLEVVAAPNLLSLVNYFKGNQVLSAPEALVASAPSSDVDFSDIKGQLVAKRVLEIAAAGGHNVLLLGPPGAGKSMLAKRLPTILPCLEPEEALELSMIYSVAGLLPEGRLLHDRPFRDPHHSASLPALVGGGIKARPGEISLAHCGVLFLDELPEFSRGALESLRQPLETGQVSVARANVHVTYPAKVQLIAAMNPCRCGYMLDATRACSRVPLCGRDYQSKISGPLLDRIDMHISIPAVTPVELNAMERGEGSASIKRRVEGARRVQRARYEMAEAKSFTNAELAGPLLEEMASPTEEGKKLLNQAADKFKLSARSYYRILKVARTIADLAHSETLEYPHVAEALCYRQMEG